MQPSAAGLAALAVVGGIMLARGLVIRESCGSA